MYTRVLATCLLFIQLYSAQSTGPCTGLNKLRPNEYLSIQVQTCRGSTPRRARTYCSCCLESTLSGFPGTTVETLQACAMQEDQSSRETHACTRMLSIQGRIGSHCRFHLLPPKWRKIKKPLERLLRSRMPHYGHPLLSTGY